MADNNAPNAQLRDLRPRIRALLPQNMQARVLAGIALLMTLVILFSGRKSGQAPKPHAAPPVAQPADPNLARIQEYQAGIEAATRQLAAEEAQLAHAKDTLSASTPVAPVAAGSPSPSSFGRGPMALSYQTQGPTASESGLEPREGSSHFEQSLFASNIALTYRPTASTVPEKSPSRLPVNPEPVPPADEESSDSKLYRLPEGTLIETVLTNRLDSSFAGPVNCMVTTNVYSPDRTTVVIPQGSRVLGEVRKVEALGEQRLAVFFHRLIRPDGYSVSLDKFQGLSQIGETGLVDQINHHYLQIFGAAIAIGSIAGLAQANTSYGVNESAADAYRQGVSSSLSQSAMRILDRYLNVLPTFTIREGHRVKVYLSQDLPLPAYDSTAAL
jgi:type IV secretory pathway VirB10-like protein